VVFDFALFVIALFALAVLLIWGFYYICNDSSRTSARNSPKWSD
jgi:hypothetical protein